jgi:hypothetical protein
VVGRNGVLGFAGGGSPKAALRHMRMRGYITGGGHGTSDSVAAMISRGEYVVNAKQTRDNLEVIRAINAGMDVSMDDLRAASGTMFYAGGGGGRRGRRRSGGGGDSDGKKAAKLLQKILNALVGIKADASPQETYKAMLKAMGKANKATPANLARITRAVGASSFGRFDTAVDRVRELRDQLQKAKDDLESLKSRRDELKESTKSAANEYVNVSQLANANDIFGNPLPATPTTIAANLTQRLATIREFGTNLKQLLNMGYGKILYDQVLQMGPEAGNEMAKALINATPSQVQTINSALSNIDPAVSAINQTTHQLHQVGIDAAQGLISGLESQIKSAEEAAERIAKAIVRTIRRVLGIRSPSKVAIDLANNFGGTTASQLAAWEGPIRRVSGRLGDAMVPTYATTRPVGGQSSSGSVTTINQDITVNTQEIDPRRHAQQLGWELATRTT